ncbi:hypothetical protein ACFQMB_17340 [Pseudobowmanella zhangzhouensis]|uniref:hypothetical protein n=1 Tax=Pseudobowmanella zhangzhouensis TaxID=1537679 RepID=UPI003613A9C8
MKRALILLSLIPTLAMATTTDKNWQATSVQTQAGQAQSAVLKSSRIGQSQGSMIQQQGAKKLSARGLYSNMMYGFMMRLFPCTGITITMAITQALPLNSM